MDIKASDLPGLLDKRVIVQEDTAGRAEDDFREVEGRVVAATETGLVIQTRSSVVIVDAKYILDVDIIVKTTPKRLVKRWIRDTDADSVKQHLLDRHGMPFDLVSAPGIDPSRLLEMHSKIDHGNLGHGHGDKPTSTRGRKRKGLIPGQRTGDHDNLDAEEIEDEVSEE